MNDHNSVPRRREEGFSTSIPTRIWQETSSSRNPYLAETCRCHGYEILELARKRSFTDVLFLLLQGELPTAAQSNLLESLMIGLINPGPRHPATRAAMNAGIGRTRSAYLLPIGLSVLSGEHLGGDEVIAAMRFFEKSIDQSPQDIVSATLDKSRPGQGNSSPLPGFGSRYGGIDPQPKKLAQLLAAMEGSGRCLEWGFAMSGYLEPFQFGWLSTGVAAAALSDLGFSPWSGAGLFQIMASPGLLAHGLEMGGQPLTAMPFLADEHFHIEPDAKAG